VSAGDRLAALLEDWARGEKSRPVGEGTLPDLRAALERSAREAVARADLPGNGEPLRLTKGRIRQMLSCERHMLAMLTAEPGEVTPELAFGVLLDILVGHRVTTGRLDDEPLELALALLEARADNQRIADWVTSLDSSMRAAFEADLDVRRHRLFDGAPAFAPEWWPRVQDRALLVLADGEAVVDCRADVVLGGVPTGTRTAIIETNSTRLRREDFDDALLYGLVFALRDEVAPDCVITCCAGTEAVQDVWIGEAELRAAGNRLGDALVLAGELAGGRAPRENPSPQCGWCPDAPVCSSALAEGASGSTAVDFDEGVLDDELF
jgi:hypothetical protein